MTNMAQLRTAKILAMQWRPDCVTKVTDRIPGLMALIVSAVLFFGVGVGQSSAQTVASAAALYQQLGSVGLDESRVYQVRDASVDREDLHISLEDGTIAFTRDVLGKPTGAFFEGNGEVLLVPIDQSE